MLLCSSTDMFDDDDVSFALRRSFLSRQLEKQRPSTQQDKKRYFYTQEKKLNDRVS